MSLLDDARRLADCDFYVATRAGVEVCCLCGEKSHAENCVVLSIPRIVAALEAADSADDEPSVEYGVDHAAGPSVAVRVELGRVGVRR